MNKNIALLIIFLVIILVFTIKINSNGRYQFIPNSDWGEKFGTIVMDTRDATIYHITIGNLKSFNPITARRKEWEISPEGEFKKIHDGF